MRNISLLGIILLIMATVACSQSQEGPNSQRRGQGQGFNPEENAKRRTEMMTKQLDLSDDQSEKVEKLLMEFGEKQREMRQEARGEGREAMREKMQKFQEEQDEKLQEILSEDQWSKWEEIRGEFQRRGPRRGRGDGQNS